MGVVHVTGSNFDAEVLQSPVPVLVDFFAEWCSPCKMMGPIMDEIATELEGKVKVVKVDVDQAQEIAAKYNVMSIPNLVIFKQGEAVDQMVGAVPKASLLEKINGQM